MTKRAKRILLIIGGIAAFVIVSFIGFAAFLLHTLDQAFSAGQYPHRPDAEMIQTFYEHRAEFGEVRTMAMSDVVIQRVDEDWTDPPNMAPDTVAKFRELFGVIKTPRGISPNHLNGELEIIASAIGWVTSGSIKGYLYAERKPSGTIMKSLDDPEVLRSVGDRYLKPIEGNWYLYFER